MEIDQIVNCKIFDQEKEEDLIEFIHACIDEICARSGPKFSKFTNVDWTEENFNDVHKFMVTLLRKPVCLYLEEEKMPKEYHQLPESARLTIINCLRVSQARLTDALLYEYSCRKVPTLLEFDWRLKYVMGSSKIAVIKEPLLQLDFILKDKEKEEILELELNKDELESMINTMETLLT